MGMGILVPRDILGRSEKSHSRLLGRVLPPLTPCLKAMVPPGSLPPLRYLLPFLAFRPTSRRPGYSSGTFWHSGRSYPLSGTLFYHLEPRRVRLVKSVNVRERWAHRGYLSSSSPHPGGLLLTGLNY